VAFTGEPVTAFAQVLSSTPVPLAVAWVDFGDGSGVTAVPAGPCRARPVGSGVVNSAAVSHRYARPGRHTTRIWARLGCGASQPVQYATATVFSYPSAPPGASAWPRCQPRQLSATLVSLGVATGNVGAQLVLRNISALPCHLYGFPGLQMLAASGVPLGCLAKVLRAFGGSNDAQGAGRGAASAVPGLAEQLTVRELDVLRLLATGAPNPRIAEQLVVSLDTVKKHVSHVLGKLGAANRTEAVTRARQLGLIP